LPSPEVRRASSWVRSASAPFPGRFRMWEFTRLPLAVTSSVYGCNPVQWASELMQNVQCLLTEQEHNDSQRVTHHVARRPMTPPQTNPPSVSPQPNEAIKVGRTSPLNRAMGM
jgi:hypothetical protein